MTGPRTQQSSCITESLSSATSEYVQGSSTETPAIATRLAHFERISFSSYTYLVVSQWFIIKELFSSAILNKYWLEKASCLAQPLYTSINTSVKVSYLTTDHVYLKMFLLKKKGKQVTLVSFQILFWCNWENQVNSTTQFELAYYWYYSVIPVIIPYFRAS